MPQHKDFGFQRGSRSKQPDQDVPNQPAKIAHRSRLSPDSPESVSCLGFAVGTMALLDQLIAQFLHRAGELAVLGDFAQLVNALEHQCPASMCKGIRYGVVPPSAQVRLGAADNASLADCAASASSRSRPPYL